MISLTSKELPVGRVTRGLLLVNIAASIIYLSWWFLPGHVGNPFLYASLFTGEIYHVLMSILFWHTVWPHRKVSKSYNLHGWPSVDVFITVAGEPIDVVRNTLTKALKISYPNFKVYILNDSYVAGKENWKEYEDLACEVGAECITRKTPGGAKAGNINNALKKTRGEIVVIFDADMAPHPDFLEKTVFYFSDEKLGFVQTPQYYKNHNASMIVETAWDQQKFFFGPILIGKDNYNSAFICGTNVAIRRVALEQAGGVCEDNIAEDFLTSLYIHQKGWKSKYVPEILAEGLGPEDLLSYYKQQLRWTRGSLEVLFAENPIFKRGLSVSQKIQYIASALFYFNGVVVLIDIAIPIIFLLFGISTVSATTTSFAFFFLPFITLNLLALSRSVDGNLSFRAIAFSHSLFYLQLTALKKLIFREKTSFSVTPKNAQEGNFIYLAYPHIAYILLTIVAFGVAIIREGISPSVVTNLAWSLFNISLFMPFIRSSYASSKNLSKMQKLSLNTRNL